MAATNLAFTRITSPIDGIVVSRNVDVGQTVAAAFQAPTLFLIANDLTKMQILANIDRKSTRLNSSHSQISYAVFCLKKKNHRLLRSVLGHPLPCSLLPFRHTEPRMSCPPENPLYPCLHLAITSLFTLRHPATIPLSH